MSFTQAQTEALSAPLAGTRVKSRTQSGRSLSYIEGWWAIAEANRIFGFDGWTRETISLTCVAEAPREIGQRKEQGWGVTYTARVRVMVGEIIREGSGTGHGIDRDKGLAHESALKEAETDAMKRALMTFGNPFGLALYDKEQNGVSHDDAPLQAAQAAAPKTQDEDVKNGVDNWVSKQAMAIGGCKSLPELLQWQDEQEDALNRLLKKYPDGHAKIMAVFHSRSKFINQQVTQ